MKTKRINTILMSSVLALVATVGSVQAMETTAGDNMMKEDTMMDDDSMMKTDEVMMDKGTMMKDEAMMTISVDLSVGSRGNDVVALQTFLESKGLLIIPAGVSKGYFGPLTQSALIKYQASMDVPATGYFGPITRGVMSNMMMKKDEAMMDKDTMMGDDSMMKKDEAMMEKETQ